MFNFLQTKKSKSSAKSLAHTPSRQWGTEPNPFSLPSLHDKPSSLKIAFSRLAIVMTIVAWLMYVTSVVIKQLFEGATYHFTMEVVGYVIIVTFLTFSALMYLIARQGAFQRFSKHVRVPRAVLDNYFFKHKPSITVLIPSYKEETHVIRKTLLSAALQEYPKISIVLLLDDDPYPSDPEALSKLNSTRRLSKVVSKLLHTPQKRFSKALARFEKQYKQIKTISPKTIKELINNYHWATDWLTQLAKSEIIEDHVDDFFTNQVLLELAKDLKLVGDALQISHDQGAKLSRTRVHQLHQRLAWIFTADIEVFERKKYLSLSHESNKAMNLNAYISLMGGKYRPQPIPEGVILTPTKKNTTKTITIPDSDFLLTLDADSILLRDYCLRLVYFLEQPDNQEVAVTQTPYSSFRGAFTRIERLSGATTDIQHILHQGMSHYGATFWVGANAVIRKIALEDIVKTEWIGGFEVKRFIQDNTVIEDTESSIDLTLNGWKLINYPERLSYSATPPDFGSLVVQRRRWANGGLLILPKLWAQVRKRKASGQSVSRTEILLRINYMASIAWSSLGLLFLLAYPYDGRLLSPLVLLAATPYFLAMAHDLKYCKYNYTDIIRIYGFNLILLPVNLAGVLKSIQQALTTKKIPFARTPKVKNRTSTGLPFVLAPLLIIIFSIFTLWRNLESQNWGNAAFAAFNALASTWAIVSYIGIKNMLVDIWLGLTSFLYVQVPVENKKPVTGTTSTLDWKVILYHGESGGQVPHTSINQIVTNSKRFI